MSAHLTDRWQMKLVPGSPGRWSHICIWPVHKGMVRNCKSCLSWPLICTWSCWGSQRSWIEDRVIGSDVPPPPEQNSSNCQHLDPVTQRDGPL